MLGKKKHLRLSKFKKLEKDEQVKPKTNRKRSNKDTSRDQVKWPHKIMEKF